MGLLVLVNWSSLGRFSASKPRAFVFFHVVYATLMITSLSWTRAHDYGASKTQKFAVISMLAYCFPIIAFRKPDHLRTFARCLIVGAIVCAIATIFFPSYQQIGRNSFSLRATAFSSNPLNPAFLMATAASLLVIPGNTVRLNVAVRIGIFVLLEAGILATGSRSMGVQAILAVIIWAYLNSETASAMKKRYRVLIGIVFVVGSMYLLFGDANANTRGGGVAAGRVVHMLQNPVEAILQSGRMELWTFVLNNFSDAPFMGHGAGGFAIDYHGIDGRLFPHNLFLEALYEHGVIGLIALAGMVIVSLGGINRLIRKSPNRRIDQLEIWYATTVAALLSVAAHWDVADCRLMWSLFGICTLLRLAHEAQRVSQRRLALG